MNANETPRSDDSNNQLPVNQPEIVLIRKPFRVLAGILVVAVFVPMLYVMAQSRPVPWSGLAMVGWSILVIGMLALTGKPWPDWTKMHVPHNPQS